MATENCFIRQVGERLGWTASRAWRPLTGLLLLGASFGALAQAAFFTAPGSVINAFVGDSVFAELQTQDVNSVPTGGGPLNWQLGSCAPLIFAASPPSVATAGGLSTAELSAKSPGQCVLNVAWDDDSNGSTFDIVPSQPLTINVMLPAGGPSVTFTAPSFFVSVPAGQSGTAQVFTQQLGKPSGAGTLFFSIEPSCPHVTLGSVPTSPGPGGISDAVVNGVSAGTCQVMVAWDHDNDSQTPEIVAMPTLTVDVPGGQILTSPVSGPAPIISEYQNPQFTVQVTADGIPLNGGYVAWSVFREGKPVGFFGSICSSEFVTDAAGFASFDFDFEGINHGIGDYLVVAESGNGDGCGGRGAHARSQRGNPATTEFLFGVEATQLVFENPEFEIQRGVPSQYTLVATTLPSNVPISGIELEWGFDLNASPGNGTTPVTDASGRASFTLTPSELGFGDLSASPSVPAGRRGSPAIASIGVGVFDLELDVVVNPPSQTPTDEIAAPITVFASKDFGFAPRPITVPQGNGSPVAGVPVTFSITTANGTFTANNSTTFVAITGEGQPQSSNAPSGGAGPGEAQSSPILIGRTANPVNLTISSPGFTSTSATYGTTPSTYSIQQTSSPSVSISVGETAPLVAQVLRGNFSAASPIGAGETVTWTISSPATGATVTPSSLTDSASNATGTFTPQSGGTYTVVAQFDPGITGVSPSTVAYTINVSGPIIVPSLTPFQGDFTRGGAGLQFPISVRYLEDGQPATPPTQAVILWSVSSGDATINPSTSSLNPSTGTASTNVTFGSVAGPIIVSAQLGSSQISTFFYLDLVDNLVLEITDPSSRQLDLAPGEPFDISVLLRAEFGAGLSGELISVSSDIAGLDGDLQTLQGGGATVSGTAPPEDGTYFVGFVYEGPTSSGPGPKATGTPPLSERVRVNVRGEPPVGTVSVTQVAGDGQRGLINSAAQPIRALYSVDQVPQPGASVLWEVISGGGTPTRIATQSDANGIATFDYTFGPTPGPVMIRASVGEANAIFTITGELAALTIVSGNGQRGPIQTDADQPLVVSLVDAAGVGIANETIQWSVTGGAASLVGGSGGGSTTQVVTDGNGRAQVNVRFGATPGAIAIQATTGLAMTPVLFAAQAETPTLRIISGNNQTAEPSTLLTQDLVVSIAPELSKALGGVAIVWEVVSGGGSLATASTPTDNAGQARNQLTLGAQAGANVVRASVQGGPSVTFNATGVVTAVELSIISGNNQAELPTNQDSAPLIVRLQRAGGGAPVANATIVWTGNNAGFVVAGNETALANQTTSVTNGQGEARIIARVIASGPASVSARLQNSTGDPLIFALQGAIANTASLNANEVRVAEVLDSACVALESIANRTPVQEDLLQRCRELQNNSGPNPDGVSDALEQLDPDVALAMTGAGLEVVTTQLSNVNNYLIEARNNPGGRGQFKVALTTADGALPLSFLPTNLLAANAAQDDSAEGQDLGPDFGRWGFFASGTIGRGKFRNGDRTPDYDYSSGNLTAGVDYRLSESVILGGGVGYSRNDTDLRNEGGTLDTSGLNFVGFASWYNERQWFVDGVLSLGRNDYDLRRNIRYSITSNTGATTAINQIASSATEGDQLGMSLAVGRDWQTGPWSINSYLRANYVRTDFDAYSERTISNLPGSGLALAVDARELTSTSSVIGSKATYVISRDWGILMPHAQLEWEHSFDDDPSQLVTRFLADPTGTSFVQFGDEIDGDFFNVGVGLSALWPGGRSAYVAYERLVSSSQLSQDTLSLGIRIEF